MTVVGLASHLSAVGNGVFLADSQCLNLLNSSVFGEPYLDFSV
jgi:hypothetical protein